MPNVDRVMAIDRTASSGTQLYGIPADADAGTQGLLGRSAVGGEFAWCFTDRHQDNLQRSWPQTWDGGSLLESFVVRYVRTLTGTVSRHSSATPLVLVDFVAVATPERTAESLSVVTAHNGRGHEVDVDQRMTAAQEFLLAGQDVPPDALDQAATVQCGAVREIESLTGWRKTELANFLGVDRQAIYLWLSGGNIAPENLKRLLAIRDVLRRASANHSGQNRLQGWLYTPRGADAVTPADLLAKGEMDRARLLAMATTPPREQPIPAWIRSSAPDPWTLRQEHRPFVVDADAEVALDTLLADGDPDGDG